MTNCSICNCVLDASDNPNSKAHGDKCALCAADAGDFSVVIVQRTQAVEEALNEWIDLHRPMSSDVESHVRYVAYKDNFTVEQLFPFIGLTKYMRNIQ